ncbi:MAG TPA: DUF2157 domain-containing protein [Nocardioidaceae bacterium]|nr:DUF2157 domain-containing protein [Nocardioidaceae bacterium]
MTMRSETLHTVDELVDRWVQEGLVTSVQAERMHAEVATLEGSAGQQRTRAASVLAEALGYVGGAVILAGSLLIGSWYWEDLTTGVRIGLLMGAATLLLGAGALVPVTTGEVGERLRSVLWLASTGAVSGSLGVLVADVLDVGDADGFLVVAGGTAVYAAAQWVAGRGFLQQIAFMVTLALTAVATINKADLADDLPGLGAWVVGIGWALLGWRGVVGPRRPVLALGSVMTVLGAMTTGGADAGMALTMVTVLAVVVCAVALRDLALLAVGTVAALVNTPAAMTRWFPDSIAPAFALVLVGVALVGTAVWVTRQGRSRRLHP